MIVGVLLPWMMLWFHFHTQVECEDPIGFVWWSGKVGSGKVGSGKVRSYSGKVCSYSGKVWSGNVRYDL